jgi:hypothetical protein
MANTSLIPPSFLNPPITPIKSSGYSSATAPTVFCETALLYNNSSKNPVLKTDVKFLNITTDLTNNQYNWYKNDDVLSDLRVRFVLSFDGQVNKTMDYVSQRINEYQADMLPYRGSSQESVGRFIEEVTSRVDESFVGLSPPGTTIDVLSPDIFDEIMSPKGFFNTVSLTRTLKNKPSSVMYYANVEDSILNDVVVYDIPIRNIFKFDKEGNVLTQKLERSPVPLGNIESQNYQFEIVTTNGFEIDLGALGLEQFNPQNFSLYSFCYFDFQAFIERVGNELQISEIPDNDSIRNGMGFLDQRTFFGTRTKFEEQTGDFVKGPLVLSTLQSPQKQDYIDARDVQNLSLDNLRAKVQDTLYKTGVGSIGIPKGLVNLLTSQNYFSELWLCKDQNENTRMSFAFDVVSYLSEASPLPFMYVSQQMAAELISGGRFLRPEETTKVLEMDIKKRRVKKDSFLGSNALGSMTKNKVVKDSRILNERKITAGKKITSLFLSEGLNNGIDVYEAFYTNTQEKKSQSLECCQYGAEVVVKDSSLLLLTRVQKLLEKMEKTARDIYAAIITSPPSDGIYDIKSHELKTSLSSIPYGVISSEEALIEVINEYVFLLESFGVIRQETTDVIFNENIAKISQKNPDGIKTLADSVLVFFGEINALLKTYYPDNTSVDGSVSPSKISTSRTTKNILLSLEHYFSNINDYGDRYGSGYSYLTDAPSAVLNSVFGLTRISKQQHLDRSQTEFSKYFNLQGSTLPDPLSPGFSNSSITFYSPLKVNFFGEDSINQLNIKKDNESVLDFNFDDYGKAFLNFVSLSSNNLPYQNLSVTSAGNSLETTLNNKVQKILNDSSCVYSQDISEKFEELEPKVVRDDITTVVTKNNKSNRTNALSNTLLGGGLDDSTGKSTAVVTFSPSAAEKGKNIEKDIIDKDFAQESKKDTKDEIFKQPKKFPAKILFNLVGEITFNPETSKMDNTRYMNLQFNSLSSLVKNYGANPQNIQDFLSDFDFLPNQFKSMIILSVMNQGMQLGNGFDAVRPRLKDKVEIAGEEFISAVFNEGEYPPYERTGDPMKLYAKMAAFWLNYKQIVAVEYLAGFNSVRQNSLAEYYLQTNETNSFYYKTKLPVWKKFTQEFYQQNIDRTFLCRLRLLNEKDYVRSNVSEISPDRLNVEKSEIFDLPIYNEYFLLTGASEV